MAHNVICHISVLFLRWPSCQCCCVKTLQKLLGDRLIMHAVASDAVTANGRNKKRGKNLFNLFFCLFVPPSIAQKVSGISDDDSSGSPLLQAEVVTFRMLEFLKAWTSRQSCPGSSGRGSCQSGWDFVGKQEHMQWWFPEQGVLILRDRWVHLC